MAAASSTSDRDRYRPIHDHPNLCQFLLNKVGSKSIPLRIAASTVVGAGSGLFVDENVAEGQELFRSHPLLTVRNPDIEDVCDVCFQNSWSNCHADGRFYKENEKRPAIARCNSCKVACYCSKACQKKAWRMYHKLECATLKQKPDLPVLDVALMRILNWFKLGALEPEGITALRALEMHLDKHCRSDTENGEGPPSALLSALDARINTESPCSLDVIQELCCMLRTNCFTIQAAEKEANLGTSFDYVVSLINHSCDENTHIFFEGNELRVRSVRSLKAGDEIFVCYTDARADVLQRRDDLKKFFRIDCNCNKCKEEIKDHLKEIGSRKKPLQHLRKCQDGLKNLETKMSDIYWNLYPRAVQMIYRFEEDMATLRKKAFSDGKWPAHVEPLPSCNRTLAAMYNDMRNAVALKFYLAGTLYTRTRSGRAWVLDLFEVVRCLIRMTQHPDDSPMWTVQGFLERDELRDVARGYLQQVCIAAKTVFGLDTKFVSALYKFTNKLLDHPGDPTVGTAAFVERYHMSQFRLLDWAGIDKVSAVAVPDAQAVAVMIEDINMLTDKEQ